MSNVASIQITSCKSCPHFRETPYMTADSFERAHNWLCGKMGDKKIQGYVEWHEEKSIEIPNWCPLLTNK